MTGQFHNKIIRGRVVYSVTTIVFEYVDKSPDWHGRIAMQNVKTGWAQALLVF